MNDTDTTFPNSLTNIPTPVARNKCRIIGVLDNASEGLGFQAIDYIHHADVVIGGARTIELFKDILLESATTLDFSGKLSEVPNWIQDALNEDKNVVVLATGDPLCHGIARFLISKVGIKKCDVIPNITTLQLAFAKFGIAWQDSKICSIHKKDTGEWRIGSDVQHGLYDLLQATSQHDIIAIFTSPENSPSRVSRMLLLEGKASYWTMHIAERLNFDDEQLHPGLEINHVAHMEFMQPNVIILQRIKKMTNTTLFGLADESYLQRKPEKGLITKCEVRAVSLARMQLKENSVVWDIGAGSGSIGLEAARLCRKGHVFAIEKNETDFKIIENNRLRMSVTNYTIINGKAPDDLLESWPDPDSIFIGGSGGELATLISLCLQRLKDDGNLVMNFVTLENLSTAVETLKQSNTEWDVVQLSASRSQPILNMNRLAAENPVWIVCVKKVKT